MVDYGAAAAVTVGGATTFVVIVVAIVKWRTLERESRVKFARFLKISPVLIAIGLLYFGLFDHTPLGKKCQKSTSPDDRYVAERCLLDWVPGGNSEYVGRVFDAKTGKKLAQHTFSTPVPELRWSPGVLYSLKPESPPSYIGPSVAFSRGNADDGDSSISLPPSKWDRLLAARPRL